MKAIALLVSLLLNVLLIGFFIIKVLDGCAEVANGKVGSLKHDLKIGKFEGSDTIFTLPKGLIVRNVSASGAGWFEPHRFRVVITSDDENLVQYSESNETNPNLELYSADVEKRKNRNK